VGKITLLEKSRSGGGKCKIPHGTEHGQRLLSGRKKNEDFNGKDRDRGKARRENLRLWVLVRNKVFERRIPKSSHNRKSRTDSNCSIRKAGQKAYLPSVDEFAPTNRESNKKMYAEFHLRERIVSRPVGEYAKKADRLGSGDSDGSNWEKGKKMSSEKTSEMWGRGEVF